MTFTKATWAFVATALCCSLLALTTSAPVEQDERGEVSFPRYIAREEGSPYGWPLWIDASELLTESGTFRRPDLADVMPGPAEMLERFDRARADGTYRGGGDCFEDGIATMGSASAPTLAPVNMADLEVLALAIIRGRITGMEPGFLRGRAVGLYQIEVLDVLKDTGTEGSFPAVFLFWPETRFDFSDGCIQWSVGGWFPPPPEVGREILLTPLPGALESIANYPAIVAWGGAEAIYETDSGLSAPLPPKLFPEVFSASSIRDLELVQRLRGKRQGR